jgi:hypothetical protein
MTAMIPAHNAPATCATTPYLIWTAVIEEVLCNHGVRGDWLREPQQRGRMMRYYHAGEPAWIACDALFRFWRGVERATREDQDGMDHIRKAASVAKVDAL